jgi:hypothetical protein
MADRSADGDGSPRLCILSLGPKEEKELVASSPCREATAEEQDGEKEVAAEIGGDGELGRRSGGQGQELREATTTKTWCKGGTMSVRCITREEKERKRGRSFTSDEFY